MKLLIVTQKIDKDDPVLGFFHGWVAAFAGRFESVRAVCLERGAFDLPKNVTVFSLGKEDPKLRAGGGLSGFFKRVGYAWRFLREVVRSRREYDAVLVHMNQEYLLVAGWYWRLAGKRSYMWRNHHKGGFLTDIAAAFCDKVFCTSRYSYTAKYAKTVLMPVGVDADLFKPIALKDGAAVIRDPRSVLFLSRMAPVKKPDLLVEALAALAEEGEAASADFYGDPLPKDAAYLEETKRRAASLGLFEAASSARAAFHPGVPNHQAPALYSSHAVFVNASSSGMYDKTIFEAMACGALPLASNENLRGLIEDRFIFKEGDAAELALKLRALLRLGAEERASAAAALRRVVVEHHSLSALADRLASEIASPRREKKERAADAAEAPRYRVAEK